MLQLDIYSEEQRNCCIGVFLFKFATGVIILWGQVNIYLMSYFYSFNNALKISRANLLINIATIPTLIAMIFSVQIAQRVGFSLLIRVCSVMFTVGILLSSLTKSFEHFIFCYLGISGTSYGLACIPSLTCLWSYFERTNYRKATGYAFFFFGMSSLLFTFIIYLVLNPNNEDGTILYQEIENGEQIWLFGRHISCKVPHLLRLMSLVVGLTIIPGSFLIKKKQEREELELELVSVYGASSFFLEQMRKGKTQEAPKDARSVQGEGSVASQETRLHQLTVVQGICSPQFCKLFMITFLISNYNFLLQTNQKIYGMKKIQDDQFLTIVNGVAILLNSLANIPWGYVADRFSYRVSYSATIVLYGFFAATLPWTGSSKIFFAIWYNAIGILYSGVITLASPTLIQIFGIYTGSKLIPFKGLSLVVSLYTTPVLLYVVMNVSSFDLVLFLTALSSLLGLAFSLNL